MFRLRQRYWILRIGNALALAAYLALIFYSRAHLALESHHDVHEHVHHVHHDHSDHEDHHHGEHNQDDSQDHDSSHSASDHEVMVAKLSSHNDQAISPPLLSSPDDCIACPLSFVVAPSWIDDKPKHPPPRSPEQPRSPPLL